jgi:hypothetical protein
MLDQQGTNLTHITTDAIGKSIANGSGILFSLSRK